MNIMRTLLRSLLLPALALAAPLHAQTAPAEPASGATTINSDTFRLDLVKKEGVFLGNVVMKDNRFELKSKELVIYFDANNKPERVVAKGDVTIQQGDKTTSSRQAEFITAEKKIVLTGDPQVTQKQNKMSGTTITIFPESDRMDVQGRTTVQIFP
jgi:lipopolysaccharide export system protein LptA